MKRILSLVALGTLAFVMLGTPVYAQGESGVWSANVTQWALIAGAFALALAAAFGAYSQGKAAAAACEAISRNPGAAPQIRFAFLLGVVLIESLVIYVFVISLSILFVKWPAI